MDAGIDQRLETTRHDSVLGSWTEATLRPRPELAHHVAMLWDGEGSTSYQRDRILPSACAHLLINLGPAQYLTRHPDGSQLRVAFEESWIAGAQTSYLETEAPGGTALVGVAFHPHGAFRVFGIRQSEIAGKVMALSDALGDRVTRLRERLLNTSSAMSRLAVVEAWLLQHMRRSRPGHPSVPHMVDRIVATEGRLRVEELVQTTGLSRKHVSRLFIHEVGVTPKALARIQRFHHALRTLERGMAVDWSAIAIDCGYYDQSHLTRDFHQFAGQTPEQVRHSPRPDAKTLVVE